MSLSKIRIALREKQTMKQVPTLPPASPNRKKFNLSYPKQPECGYES